MRMSSSYVSSGQEDFDLQLSESLKQKVAELAVRQGLTIEAFILNAITDKIARLDSAQPSDRSATGT